jgi:GNAT superfamily N-acetyltransferase
MRGRRTTSVPAGAASAATAPGGRAGAKATFRPLSPARWPDVERLFGARGACAGCWCMYWRLPARQYDEGQGQVNRRAFRRLVENGSAHGVLAYVDGEPVGWCAIGPRASFPRLAGSRVLAPVDDRPVWSVVCFFIARGQRRRGLASGLLDAAAAYATRHGARLLEGYPHEPRKKAMPDAFAWTGIAASFARAGFEECARRSPGRPIMRRPLPGGRCPAR